MFLLTATISILQIATAKEEFKLLTPDTGCGYSNVTHRRIVGGTPAKLGAFPWMALIGYSNDLGETSFKCGGSLISKRHVLTAAHCLKSTLSSVRLGEHNLDKEDETKTIDVNVIKAAIHPKYDKKDGHSDLAILTLEHDIPFTNRILPVCLPFEDPIRSEDLLDYAPFVAGWGRTQEGGSPSPILQQLKVPILENKECEEGYKSLGKVASTKQFDDGIICAGFKEGGKDACQGDSGGPLFLDSFSHHYFYQVGIVSYGIGCARAELPGVYTRITSFVDWIAKTINE